MKLLTMKILHIKLLILEQYEGKIVKLIVRKKSNPKKYDKFVDKLLGSDINEMKIVELRCW